MRFRAKRGTDRSIVPETIPTAWTLTEGHAGMRAQVEGLAEAMGLTAARRDVRARLPWDWLPGRIWPAPLAAVTPRPAPPWPGLVISTGNVAAPVAAALRRKGVRAVHVQNPKMDLRLFDVVVAMRHDRLSGPNVLVTRTAIHRVTQARLEAARAEWAPRLAHLPRPLVAVLAGGSNGRFTLDAAVGAALADRLATMMRQDRAGVFVTPSRRTDPAVTATLAAKLRPLGAEVWDFAGDNPYFGLIASADAIVVTQDSVSMVSEACATTAPVLIAELPGRSRRIAQFLADLRGDGRIRPFAGRLETWDVTPIDDTPQAAAEVRRRLGF